MLEFPQRRGILLKQREHLRQRVAHPFDYAVIVWTDARTHPAQEGLALRLVQGDRFETLGLIHGASSLWRKCFPNGYAHSSLIEQVR